MNKIYSHNVELTKHIEGMMKEKEKLVTFNQQLLAENTELQSKTDRLTNELDAMKSSLSGYAFSLSEREKNMANQVDSIEKYKQECQEVIEDNRALAKLLKDQKDSNALLKQELEADPHTANEYEILTEQLRESETKLRKTEDALHLSIGKICDKQALEVLKQRYPGTNSESSVTEERLKELFSIHLTESASKCNVEGITQAIPHVTKLIQLLDAQLMKVQLELISKDELHSDVANLEDKMQTAIGESRAMNKQHNADVLEIQKLQKEIRDNESLIFQSNKEIMDSKNALTSQKRKWEGSIEELKHQVDLLKTDNELLANHLKESEESLNKISQENRKKENKLFKLKKEKEFIEKAKEESDRSLSEMKEKMRSQQSEWNSLEQTVVQLRGSLKTQSKEMSSLSSQLTSSESQRIRLNAQMEADKEMLEQTITELDNLRVSMAGTDALQQEVILNKHMKEKFQKDIETERVEHENIVRGLKESLDALRTQNSIMNDQLVQTEAQLHQSKGINEDKQRKIDQLERKYEEVNGQFEWKLQEIEKAHNEDIMNLKNTIADLQAQLESRENVMESARLALVAEKQQNQADIERIRSCEDQNHELNQENDDIRQECMAYQTRIMELENVNEASIREQMKLNKIIEDLKDELTSQQNQRLSAEAESCQVINDLRDRLFKASEETQELIESNQEALQREKDEKLSRQSLEEELERITSIHQIEYEDFQNALNDQKQQEIDRLIQDYQQQIENLDIELGDQKRCLLDQNEKIKEYQRKEEKRKQKRSHYHHSHTKTRKEQQQQQHQQHRYHRHDNDSVSSINLPSDTSELNRDVVNLVKLLPESRKMINTMRKRFHHHHHSSRSGISSKRSHKRNDEQENENVRDDKDNDKNKNNIRNNIKKSTKQEQHKQPHHENQQQDQNDEITGITSKSKSKHHHHKSRRSKSSKNHFSNDKFNELKEEIPSNNKPKETTSHSSSIVSSSIQQQQQQQQHKSMDQQQYTQKNENYSFKQQKKEEQQPQRKQQQQKDKNRQIQLHELKKQYEQQNNQSKTNISNEKSLGDSGRQEISDLNPQVYVERNDTDKAIEDNFNEVTTLNPQVFESNSPIIINAEENDGIEKANIEAERMIESFSADSLMGFCKKCEWIKK
eukprot:TRINITY_DN6705_c0_g1_i10.p1 TRINITY_DN6705_c0_g1~~TRINITY_DN6705_c0_g1_i10.p1  ORF type:complete len:1139 (-),score=334.53 TRINITY_DN6705_c0_g1_i10:1428-4844(-)